MKTTQFRNENQTYNYNKKHKNLTKIHQK